MQLRFGRYEGALDYFNRVVDQQLERTGPSVVRLPGHP